MARLRLAEIASAVQGDLAAGAATAGAAGRTPADPGDRVVAGYSIDSRTLVAGDLFFAIVGPRVDGHDFVAAAVQKGAAAVVVARGGAPTWKEAPAVIKVADTTRALQDLGAHVRRRRPLKVVGITGSAGKTTAKELTAAVLSTRLKTHRSEGNLNNAYGLPLALLRMEEACQAAVLEMGMSFRGEIARLVEIADPDVGVILNVLRVHLEHFGSIDGIAEAKGELFAGMRKDAIAAYNADDARVARLGRAFPGRSIPFGLNAKGREVTAEALSTLGLAGTRFLLRHGKETTPVEIGLAGKHHVYNALAAAAAGYACGLDGEAIAAGLQSVKPAPMRGVLHRRPDGVEILDDAYNSNPVAMERALDLLTEARPRGRRILASGDMLELGPYASRAHTRLGRQIASAGIDLLVAVGPLSLKTAEAARRGKGEVVHFESSEEAAAWIASAVRPGDLVLVKGSRGIRMERVVQALLGSASGAAGAH